MRTLRLLAFILAAATSAHALAGAPEPKSVLPWIDDDYAGALAQARAKNLPIFAEAWAPWCHTCQTMRAFVFTDEALAKHAGQFVWLSIDTEKSGNASFLRKYPIPAWPSFYVIDAQKERIALRWTGGATVAQLEKIFADGLGTVHGVDKIAREALARADGLYGDGKYTEAASAYRDAIRLLPPRSPEYARAVDSLLFCFQTTHDDAACVAVAGEQMARLRDTPSAANLAGSGLDCALGLPAGAPGRAEAVTAFESDARAVLADGKRKLAADDRSAIYGSLFSALEDAKDMEGARKISAEWVADLEGEAARAATAQQRTALDPDRLSAFDAAGQIEKAIPMLEQSEKAFPQDYNPPARLAFVYWKLKQYPAALTASDRALERVYGPRKLRVLAVRADIYKGMGDAAALRKTVEDALAFAEALPQGQRSETTVASLKKQLEGTTQ
jgi:tetratricopeptide (TPR) repeat protein